MILHGGTHCTVWEVAQCEALMYHVLPLYIYAAVTSPSRARRAIFFQSSKPHHRTSALPYQVFQKLTGCEPTAAQYATWRPYRKRDGPPANALRRSWQANARELQNVNQCILSTIETPTPTWTQPLVFASFLCLKRRVRREEEGRREKTLELKIAPDYPCST